MKIKVMLVDEGHARSTMLVQTLVEAGYDVVARIMCDDDLLARLDKIDPDVLMLDLESPDHRILEQLSLVNQIKPRPIIMFADKGESSIINAAVKAGVSAYIVDGLTARRIKPVMDVALARFDEYQRLRSELDKTKASLAERKLIDRAKGIIMQQRSISEDDAYKSLRKLAMDRNQKMVDVAKNVIEVSELLM